MDERLRPEPESSRRSPSSPGKRRMVDNEKGKVRLISRGLPDSDEDDRQQVVINHPQVSVPPKEHRVLLDLSASRKRKTIEPITGEHTVLVLPSPTTQIARQIDKIRLAGTPIYGYTGRLPMLGIDTTSQGPSSSTGTNSQVGGVILPSSRPSKDETECMIVHDTKNTNSVIKPASPQHVPQVGTNVEIMEDTMEAYMQRSHHALNMKRTMGGGTEDRDSSGDERTTDIERGRRDKMVKYVHDSVRPTSQTPPIRVPTIVSSSSFPSSTAPSPPKDNNRSLIQPQIGVFPSSPASGGYILVPVALPTPATTISSSAHPSSPPTRSPPTSSPSSSSNVPRPQKVSNFSITELLAKDDKRSKSPKPVPTVFPTIPPQFMTMYYQQWYMQMMSNMKRFQGEAVESDSAHIRTATPSGSAPLLAVPDRDKTSSSPTHSPTHSPASLVSHSTEGDGNEDSSQSVGGGRQPVVTNGETRKEGEGQVTTDNRQNALLQVSEAHLAILPDEDGDTPLHLSIIQENIPLTFYLVRLICGVRMNLDIANNMRQTPLHLSIITRQPILTHLLVQNGASVNFPDRRGNTSVHLVAQRKSVDTLQILSQATNPLPDFNSRNFAGLTPVHLATKEGSIDVLKFLFQMGANKNCADSCSGRTPLHYAVESQNFQMCNFLLENGVNVNAVTFSGNTPLHVAAGRRLKEIVAVLMAYGANPAIANGEGDFPSDLPASLLMQRAKLNVR